jgi:hypothetical protein
MNTTPIKSAGELEAEAEKAAAAGDYAEAARLYELSARASLGQGRAKRLRDKAAECRQKEPAK